MPIKIGLGGVLVVEQAVRVEVEEGELVAVVDQEVAEVGSEVVVVGGGWAGLMM